MFTLKYVLTISVLLLIFGCGSDEQPTKPQTGTVVEQPADNPPLVADQAPADVTPIEQPPQPIATDSSGLIQVLTLQPLENFRNATNVNFFLIVKIYNHGETRINFGFPMTGKNHNGETVFSRDGAFALDPGQTQQWTISYGEPLTFAEYDSITTWSVGEIVTY